MKRFYWLYAEPIPEKQKKEEEGKKVDEKKEKEEKDKLEKALMDKLEKALTEKYDNIIKGYQNEINKLKEDLEESKKHLPKEKKEESEKKTNSLLNGEEILKNLKETNKLFVENKKAELIKKYNIKEEDLSTYDTIEALNELDKVYGKAFNKAKETYTSEEKMVEELKKRKKMIVDLDNGLGEEVQKQTQEKRTKGIIKFLSRK